MNKFRKPINVSFRKTYIVTTFLIICSACLLSLAIVLLYLNFLYNGEITLLVVFLAVVVLCILTITIGGFVLWKSSRWISNPIVNLDMAVKKVATGNFDLKIKTENPKIGNHEIHTEITELVNNFNVMTKELKSMEYMSKDFMTNVSHEIKTPISVISGLSEMILDEGLETKENLNNLKMINSSSERISHLCNNMLKLSKLDSQFILERKDTIRIDEQIRKATINIIESYPDIKRDLKMELSEIIYNCDGGLMMQVWLNLLENALKYSPEQSTITVSTRKIGEKTIISIHNEGKMIPEEKIRRIFERFYQCDPSHSDSGSGLGLSIVSRIIELHDGKIICVSNDRGTSFIVELNN